MRRVLLVLVILLAACIKVDLGTEGNKITGTAGVIPGEELKDLTEVDAMANASQSTLPANDTVLPEPSEQPEPVKDIPIRRVKVGELVEFPNLGAIDADGDALTYEFNDPLDEDGAWQTGPGDEGTYETLIEVSDGSSTTSQQVRIIVEPLNAPPELHGVEDVTVREGETIRLNIRATDPDQDPVRISYDGWRSTFPYTTTYKDAGVHTVKAIARDGTHTVESIIEITVQDVNRPPVIHEFDDVLVMEGDEVVVKADGDDPDGDLLTFSYSSPLNESGMWLTKKGDAGTYRVNVTASDGKVRDSTYFRIVVEPLNQEPIVEPIDDVTVTEGETVHVDFEAQDPEKEKLEITWHGWMTSEQKETGFDDAGEHLVTISVSDGYHEVNESFVVTVKNKNRPPVFVANAFE